VDTFTIQEYEWNDSSEVGVSHVEVKGWPQEMWLANLNANPTFLINLLVQQTSFICFPNSDLKILKASYQHLIFFSSNEMIKQMGV